MCTTKALKFILNLISNLGKESYACIKHIMSSSNRSLIRKVVSYIANTYITLTTLLGNPRER